MYNTYYLQPTLTTRRRSRRCWAPEDRAPAAGELVFGVQEVDIVFFSNGKLYPMELYIAAVAFCQHVLENILKDPWWIERSGSIGP